MRLSRLFFVAAIAAGAFAVSEAAEAKSKESELVDEKDLEIMRAIGDLPEEVTRDEEMLKLHSRRSSSSHRRHHSRHDDISPSLLETSTEIEPEMDDEAREEAELEHELKTLIKRRKALHRHRMMAKLQKLKRERAAKKAAEMAAKAKEEENSLLETATASKLKVITTNGRPSAYSFAAETPSPDDTAAIQDDKVFNEFFAKNGVAPGPGAAPSMAMPAAAAAAAAAPAAFSMPEQAAPAPGSEMRFVQTDAFSGPSSDGLNAYSSPLAKDPSDVIPSDVSSPGNDAQAPSLAAQPASAFLQAPQPPSFASIPSAPQMRQMPSAPQMGQMPSAPAGAFSFQQISASVATPPTPMVGQTPLSYFPANAAPPPAPMQIPAAPGMPQNQAFAGMPAAPFQTNAQGLIGLPQLGQIAPQAGYPFN